MADFSTCTTRRCGTVTPGIVAACPTCGGRILTSRRIRVLGWLMVGCGVILVGLMGYITLAMYPTLMRPGEDLGQFGRWSGTADQARMVLNLFLMVIAMGVLALVSGAWQIVTGRRNMVFIVLTIFGAIALAITTWETTTSLKQAEEQEPPLIVQPPPMAPVNLGAAAPDKPQ